MPLEGRAFIPALKDGVFPARHQNDKTPEQQEGNLPEDSYIRPTRKDSELLVGIKANFAYIYQGQVTEVETFSELWNDSPSSAKYFERFGGKWNQFEM